VASGDGEWSSLLTPGWSCVARGPAGQALFKAGAWLDKALSGGAFGLAYSVFSLAARVRESDYLSVPIWDRAVLLHPGKAQDGSMFTEGRNEETYPFGMVQVVDFYMCRMRYSSMYNFLPIKSEDRDGPCESS
jgi:hypothetical protein